MAVLKYKVGGVQYNVAQASALKQRKLMTIIAAKVFFNSQATKTQEIGEVMVKGALVSADDQTLEEIESILFERAFKLGSEKPITIEDFQNKMNDYYTLLAKCIVGNIGDFFEWLESLTSQTKPAEK